MIFNVDSRFWNKANIVAKLFLIIGFFFVDIGMRLAGMGQNEVRKTKK